MKGIRKKILLAGIASVFAFAVTIGSTYAWFTITQASNVGPVQINISTADSLMIRMFDSAGYYYAGTTDLSNILNSAGAVAYTFHDAATDYWTDGEAVEYVLSSGDLVESLVPTNVEIEAEHLNPAIADPATYFTTLSTPEILAMYDYSLLKLAPVTTVDGKAFESRAGLGETVATPAKAGYFEFSVWLLSQSKAANVILSNYSIDGLNIAPNEARNTVETAARVSVANGANPAFVYGLDKEYTFTNADEPTTILEADRLLIVARHGNYYTTGTPVADESVGTIAAATTAFSLLADIPTKITIRIWIEGWDGECVNDLLASVFAMGFGFTIQP